jgi:sec-independent protein translocase protein TatB
MDLSPEKLLVLFIIAVLVLGPERLPGVARTLGRGLGELRRHTSQLRSEFGDILTEPKRMVEAAAREADLRAELDVRQAAWGNGNGYGEGPQPADAIGATGFESELLADDLGDGQFLAGTGADGAGYVDMAASDEAWVAQSSLPPGAPDDPLLN